MLSIAALYTSPQQALPAELRDSSDAEPMDDEQ